MGMVWWKEEGEARARVNARRGEVGGSWEGGVVGVMSEEGEERGEACEVIFARTEVPKRKRVSTSGFNT